jgi:hypothetical protein
VKRLAAAALLGAVVLAGCGGGSHRSGGTVVLDHTWTCTSHVDLALVQVKISPQTDGPQPREDAVHLRDGCTGRIGKLVVDQWSGDGVKVAQGVHDLTVDGGSVRCHAKAPVAHQDGIQVMGGENILFRDLAIDCGREHDRLINSNLFIKKAGRSTSPPKDVVCDGCRLGGWAAHTVDIQASVGSGIRNSTLCPARFPHLTLTIGPEASEPVNSRNEIRQCGQPR